MRHFMSSLYERLYNPDHTLAGHSAHRSFFSVDQLLLEEFFLVRAKVEFQGPRAALLADELPVDCRHGVWVQFVICCWTHRKIGEATVEHDVSDVNASRPEFSCQGLRQPTGAELGAGERYPTSAHR